MAYVKIKKIDYLCIIMESFAPRYAEVVLPLALTNTLTYAIPADIAPDIAIGCRVIVPVKEKFYTGIVVAFHTKADACFEIKNIASLLDARPVVRTPQLRLWNWMQEYYLCTVGEVYRAAVPSGLKIESETVVGLNPDFEQDSYGGLTEKEAELILFLRQRKKPVAISAIGKELEMRGLPRMLESLLSRGVLQVSEKLNEKYRPKIVRYVELAVPIVEAFGAVRGKNAQENVLLAYAELLSESGAVPRDALVAKAKLQTESTLSTMAKKGIIRVVKKEVNRFSFSGNMNDTLPSLSEAQTAARDSILAQWKEKSVVLLHGVTSSGKTEIYIDLISRTIAKGRRAFFLVPEIALTTQLTTRLQSYFGLKVLIYHSKFTDSERVDVWNKLLRSDEPCVVIGARSAVFLPFGNLGLVIVDEEHDASYKQEDPAPRYNARDVAIVLASMHGAKTLLGSATPSVETRYKSDMGKFGLAELTQRYGDLPMPEVSVVDIVAGRRDRTYRAPFTLELVNKANSALGAGGQAIFFLNRRGFAPVARCALCDWSPRCPNCDVALTYHKSRQLLECHYCGTVRQLPVVCPQCGEPRVEILGFGTERVEDALAENFPDRKILRMDLDTTRNKEGYNDIISEFSEGKADILVGTQMVTKGLDFGKVSVVGVLNADIMLNQPDFRASERTFNMLEQVAGRAGRRAGSAGYVVIQTSRPDHPVIKAAAAHDYAGYYSIELEERRRFNFPPFSRIIVIVLKHSDVNIVHKAAMAMAESLVRQLGNRVNGPHIPLVSRIKAYHIRHIMLKIEIGASLAHVKEILRRTYVEIITADSSIRGVVVQYDVDPA